MGNTLHGPPHNQTGQDHPHIHGEYVREAIAKGFELGSPPHTWGIRFWSTVAIAAIRITPTYMGNTPSHRNRWRRPEDHPHIHGEYYPVFRWPTYPSGSPPHTWGIPFSSASQIRVNRITPTYMGNTIRTSSDHVCVRDHPHIHGEYSLDLLPKHRLKRITPTYMGNTQSKIGLS